MYTLHIDTRGEIKFYTSRIPVADLSRRGENYCFFYNYSQLKFNKI